MKRLTAWIYLPAALFLTLAGCNGVTTAPVAAPAPVAPAPVQSRAAIFTSPEAAIRASMQALADNDIDALLQACAAGEMGEKFSFDLYSERLGQVIAPNALAPAEYPLYAQMNQVAMAAQILGKVKFFAYGLLSGETIDGSVQILDEARVGRFLHDVDPARLATLHVEKVALPNAALMKEARYQETATAIAKVYGADESTERVLLFSFEGAYYSMGFTLLRYGESWKISDLASALANTSVLGVPAPTTVAEFDATFGSDSATP